MKKRNLIFLIFLVLLLLSACGPAATTEVIPVEQVPASQTPIQAASDTPAPTPTALPSATSTSDPTLVMLEQYRRDLLAYLQDPIEAAIAAYGGDWYILLHEMGGESLYARQADTPVWVGNLIHLPITALFLKAIEDTGVTEMKVYLTVHRDYETSLRQTLYEMLVYGNQTAATSIEKSIPSYGMHVNQVLQDWDLADTSLPNRMSSAADMVRLMEGLASRELLSEESTVMIYDMLDQGDKTDNPLYQLAPQGTVMHDKQVSVFGENAMLGEVAVVESGGSTYLLAILGFSSAQQPATYAGLVQAYAGMAQAFWAYVGTR